MTVPERVFRRVLLDTNVILDYLLAREPFGIDARSVIRESLLESFQLLITVKQAADVYYLMHSEFHSKAKARGALIKLRQLVAVADNLGDDVDAALMIDYPDFEDALIVRAAERMRVDAIVTRDRTGFTLAQCPVYTPRQFLRALGHA